MSEMTTHNPTPDLTHLHKIIAPLFKACEQFVEANSFTRSLDDLRDFTIKGLQIPQELLTMPDTLSDPTALSLLAAIEAAPDEFDRYLILADRLQEIGEVDLEVAFRYAASNRIWPQKKLSGDIWYWCYVVSLDPVVYNEMPPVNAFDTFLCAMQRLAIGLRKHREQTPT